MEAAAIVTLRTQLGLSQQELGRLLGVSHAMVWRWERGTLEQTEQQASLLDSIERAVKRDPVLTKCVRTLLVREGAVPALFHILQRSRP